MIATSSETGSKSTSYESHCIRSNNYDDMMRPLQYSPSPGGIGNSTTTTQNSTGISRPIAKDNLPQLAGRGLRLPRLAGSPASTPSPALRRDSRTEHNGITTPKRNEDIETPVKAFLSSNITPRSGSRKARVDSSSSTPTGTPDGTPRNSRPSSIVGRSGQGKDEAHGIAGLGIRGGRTSRPRSLISDGGSSSLSFAASADGRSYTAGTTSPESSPMFFHASEVDAKLPPIAQRIAPPVRAQSFQYANGEYETEINGSPSSLSPPVEEQRPKFFHANAATDADSSSFRFPYGKTSSRPLLETIPSAQSVGDRQRSPSPLKEELHFGHTQRRPTSPLKDQVIPRRSSISKASPRRHTRLVSTGAAGELKSPVAHSFSQGGLSRKSSLSTLGQNRTDIPITDPSMLSRRSSLSTPSQRKFSHTRSSSVNAVGSSPGRRSVAYSDISSTGFNYKKSPPPDLDKTSPENNQGSPMSRPQKSSPSISSPEPKPSSPSSSPPFHSQPQSPARPTEPSPGKSKLDHLNDLAASARRERKVLDLEISNSSLLAINQTLEREMRKQALELRRFRRISRRSGISSKRTTLGENDVHSGEDDSSEDHSSPTYDGDEDNEDGGSDIDCTSRRESSFSPTMRTSSIPIPTRLKKSSKPFLDLTRQRTLLIDSQKLNQSLKRCLGRTEEMIADAKKALDFQVRIDELESSLGGRILTPDDERVGEWGPQGKGLLSPSLDGLMKNPWDVVGQRESSKEEAAAENEFVRKEGEEIESELEQRDGSKEEGNESDIQGSEDLESVGAETPSSHEEVGGKGLGRYLGSLGESLGL